jgi:hypothetical protein
MIKKLGEKLKGNEDGDDTPLMSKRRGKGSKNKLFGNALK